MSLAKGFDIFTKSQRTMFHREGRSGRATEIVSSQKQYSWSTMMANQSGSDL